MAHPGIARPLLHRSVLNHPDDGNPSNNRGWNNTQVKQAASEVRNPVRIWNRWPAGCPAIDEGGDEVVWPRVLVGYGLFGLLAGPWLARVLLPHVGLGEDLASLAVGWVWGAALGFIAESIRASIGGRRSRERQRDGHERPACNVVELTVDSYRFRDAKGKDAEPHLMFAPRPPAWPARLEPATFAFAPGEAYRDVLLIVDAPDDPGPAEVFNVNARQDGMATGGVSVVINRKQA